jgi:hypothetical protein
MTTRFFFLLVVLGDGSNAAPEYRITMDYELKGAELTLTVKPPKTSMSYGIKVRRT